MLLDGDGENICGICGVMMKDQKKNRTIGFQTDVSVVGRKVCCS
jgi:hypothetical protein